MTAVSGASAPLSVEDPAVVAAARGALASIPGLCDACLGRGAAKVGRGFTNASRGASLRRALGAGEQPDPSSCAVCRGAAAAVDRYAALVVRELAGWEFRTFRIGCKVDPALEDRERALWAAAGSSWTEPLRREVDREVGKRVELATGTTADILLPDIVALVDTRFDRVTLEVRSVFLWGRYRKLVRGIPQTRWPCRICRGSGCRRCSMTGKMYPTSVEELMAAPALGLFQGAGSALHGMGREDVDARMLGDGRPFVLEILAPHRRSGELDALAAAIDLHAAGQVEVRGLRWSQGDEVVAVKEARHDKTYVAEVAFEGEPGASRLEEIAGLFSAKRINQRTPVRVAHRRADAVRGRDVRSVKVLEVRPDGARLEITGEAGLYIKELVSGDGGRTEPSLAGLLGIPARVVSLDVIAVHDQPTGGGASGGA